MSSSTALLPKNKKDELSITMRVCHSPWACIDQKALVTIRGCFAFYILAISVLLVFFKERDDAHRWTVPFDYSVLVCLLQLIYAWISFIWSFMHLYYPHQGTDGLKRLLSPPRLSATSVSRAFFSIFYTAATTYPHIATLVYWSILIPHQQNEGMDFFSRSWLQVFITINAVGINSFIALIEILLLSSVRRQRPIWAHVVGLTVLCLTYVGWVYIGRLLTGVFVYYFFDYNLIGWEHVIVAIASFCALSNIFFAVAYGITGMREMWTKHNDGYVRLPQ